MPYSKIYYFIQVISRYNNGAEQIEYYGKNKKRIPISDDNIAWYIKEYGFDTTVDAYKDLRKIARWYDRNKFKYSSMQIQESSVTFKSYEEYLQIKS